MVYSAASSLDGFIADAGGGVEWLEGVPAGESRFAAFYAGVGSLVLGRRTFDQVLGFGWPYGEKPAAVLTSSGLPPDAPSSAFAVSGDDLTGVVALLRRRAEGDVWVVGGGATAGALLRAGLVEEVELGVMPILLGGGVPLLSPAGSARARLELLAAEGLANGIVWLRYRVTG